MKKPQKNASAAVWASYKLWVKEQVKNWFPEDDKGGPDVYVPRFNGIRAEDIEGLDETLTQKYKDQEE